MAERKVFLKKGSMRSFSEKKQREIFEITKCDSNWKKKNHSYGRGNAGGTWELF